MQNYSSQLKISGSKFPNSQNSDCTVGNNLNYNLILTRLISNITKYSKSYTKPF